MIDGNGLTPTPTPPPKVGRLESLRDVRRELSRVYRDARQNKISTVDGSRLAFMLATIAKIIEGSDFEARLEKLERDLYASTRPKT